MWYGSLNIIGLHNFIGSDNCRKCGFVGVGAALLEQVCHGGGQALGSILLRIPLRMSVDFMWPAYQDATRTMPAFKLPCPTMMIMDGTS